MDALRAERVSLLLARALGGALKDYYARVEQASEEELPASRVLRVEALEPLGLAVQMYCLYLRALECDAADVQRIMAAAWGSLQQTPEMHAASVTQALAHYERMRAYPVFRERATIEDMVLERCDSILPALHEAPELRQTLASITQASWSGLQRFVLA